MDGNGRWASKRLLPRSAGHEAGVNALKNVIKAAHEIGVRVVSVYAFSTENWKRPKDEVDKLFNLLRSFLKEYKAELLKSETRLRIMGDVAGLPQDLRVDAESLIKETAGFDKYVLNIGLNYGSRAEILRAVNALLASGIKTATEKDFESRLYTAGLPDPDLLIRTGESRLSNFMLYQAAYTEIYFTGTLWPAFGKREFLRAVEEYKKRDRKYGDIK